MASSERARRPPSRDLPELPPGTDFLDFLVSLPPEARDEAVRALGFTEAEAFDREWPIWAHEGQEVPAGDWSTCVAMGGRGFGKTWTGSQWILSLIRDRAAPRIALVGATLAEARRVMVEGPSGLLEVAGPWIREWRPSLGTLRFRDGAVATLFSGHSPELLRGPEHHFAWCDELAKWEKAQECWDMLQFGLRAGTRPRALITTTPRPGPVLRGIMASPGTVVIGGPSDANPHNSQAWLREKRERYAGTRLARQELDGELLTDSPGALWTVELLERCLKSSPAFAGEGERACEPRPGDAATAQPDAEHRWPEAGGGAAPPSALRAATSPANAGQDQFVRIIIGVDPPAGDGTCGIVACAKDEAGNAHVLADHSVTALSPEGWSRAVADAAKIWGQSLVTVPLVVAEQNQGGRMVEAVLRIADPDLAVKPVTATQSKIFRASPVAMLFEAGRVVLHGRFPALEAELLGMIAGGDYEGPGTSPDRADAMVWALTELMLGKERAEPRIRRL